MKDFFLSILLILSKRAELLRMLKNSQYDFLVVDDQDVVVQLMRSILRNNGYRKVYTAKDGKSALGILDKSKESTPKGRGFDWPPEGALVILHFPQLYGVMEQWKSLTSPSSNLNIPRIP